MDNLSQALKESFDKNSDNIALEVEGLKITYRELYSKAAILASLIYNVRAGGGGGL